RTSDPPRHTVNEPTSPGRNGAPRGAPFRRRTLATGIRAGAGGSDHLAMAAASSYPVGAGFCRLLQDCARMGRLTGADGRLTPTVRKLVAAEEADVEEDKPSDRDAEQERGSRSDAHGHESGPDEAPEEER